MPRGVDVEPDLFKFLFLLKANLMGAGKQILRLFPGLTSDISARLLVLNCPAISSRHFSIPADTLSSDKRVREWPQVGRWRPRGNI